MALTNAEQEVANRRLWDELRKVDPDMTKPYRGGRGKFTAIDPMWRYQRLTEMFGAQGVGWGFETDAPILTEECVFIGVRIWYVMPGEVPAFGPDSRFPVNAHWTGTQFGGTPLWHTKDGKRTGPNDEAFKMSVTDGFGKAASTIGLAADVYMGKFDGDKHADYLGEVKQEFDQRKVEQDAVRQREEAAKRQQEIDAKKQAHKITVDNLLAEVWSKVPECRTLDALNTLYKNEFHKRIMDLAAAEGPAGGGALKESLLLPFKQQRHLIENPPVAPSLQRLSNDEPDFGHYFFEQVVQLDNPDATVAWIDEWLSRHKAVLKTISGYADPITLKDPHTGEVSTVSGPDLSARLFAYAKARRGELLGTDEQTAA